MQWKFKDVIVLNRYLSWFFGVGYVVIHYIYPHRHGEGSMMVEGEMVPRIFFMTSFVWLLFHAVVAQKMHGWPNLRFKSLRDVYVFDAWLVLFITTPIFSIPALGASQLLMAIAWPPLALHLALNVWYTLTRAPWHSMRKTWVRVSAMVVWLAIIAGAAVQSFPLGDGHSH
jgi:hypothetical protein